MTSDQQTTRYTLDVKPGDVARGVQVAREFLTMFPDNHRTDRPERHGVVSQFKDGAVFYAYGNPQHVRVRQDNG